MINSTFLSYFTMINSTFVGHLITITTTLPFKIEYLYTSLLSIYSQCNSEWIMSVLGKRPRSMAFISCDDAVAKRPRVAMFSPIVYEDICEYGTFAASEPVSPRDAATEQLIRQIVHGNYVDNITYINAKK